MKTAAAALAVLLLLPPPAAGGEDSVFLEELTWTEVRDRLAAGAVRVIVPAAGTEQNGPHMALGKHRYIVERAAGRIARELGRTLVAPAMTYVPEGDIDPPSGHMRWPGTISLPEEHFVAVLVHAARSLAAHGFTDILFLSDSGGNTRGLERAAAALAAEWEGGPARAHHISDYYGANGFREWLASQGETPEAIGRHAGISDTSQLLHVAPEHVRLGRLAPMGGFEGSGASGDPTRASAAYGRKGLELKAAAAVRQARALLGEDRAARP